MSRFLTTLVLMFSALAVGYLVRVLVERRTLRLPFELPRIRKVLQTAVLLFSIPLTFLGAVWIVDLDNLKILALPFIEVFAILLGGVLAYGFARAQKLTRRQTGPYIVTGAFGNVGAMGGLICYMFLGEAAFALVGFYKLFEELMFFAFALPIAKSFSLEQEATESLGARFKKVLADPFVLIPLGGLTTGLILNLSGVPRPAFYSRVNAILIPTIPVLLLFTIGMAMRFGSVHKHIRKSALIVLVRQIVAPAAAVAVALALGYGTIADGLPLKVVLICSCMPVAFMAMIPPAIYNLDVEVANSNWLLTNALLVVLVPALYFAVKVI
jgi:predicted permease